MFYKKRERLIVYLSMLLVVVAASFFCLTCVTGSAVYGGLNPKETVPVMQNLRQGILANGLRYYIYENRKPENRASLTLAVNAGAVLEEDDENGLAHFVEHMAFNGTKRFSESEVVDYLRSLGMRFGADANAFTNADATVYGIDVPIETSADGTRTVPDKALDILDDWTYAVSFEPEAVEDERRVIMEEYRVRRFGAAGRQQKILLEGLLAGSRYAERDVIGLPEIIENAPAERIKGFYKKWYRPENMALIFVGDFDGAALEENLSKHFTAPAENEQFERPLYFLPPPQKNNIQVEISADPEIPYTQIALFYKQKYEQNKDTIAEYRKSLIDTLINRMLTERFNDRTLDSHSPFNYASADLLSIVRPSLFYSFNIVVKPGMAEAALDEILAAKESLRRYGFSDPEIERAKRSLLSDTANFAVEKEKNESFIIVHKLTSRYFENAPIPDIDWELTAAEKLLPSITPKDIHKAVKDYFLYNDVFVFISAPEAESIPSADAIMQKVKSAGGLKIQKPDETVFDSMLLDLTPELGGIDEEIIHEDTGIVEWRLENGARVLLKNTENKNDEIALHASARGGTAASPLEDSVSAKIAPELLSASGAGPWTRRELVKKLSEKQVSFSFSADDFTRRIQGYSNTADLKTMFELLYLTFTDPRIDAEAVSVVADEYKTLLARRSENPEEVFFDEIEKVTYSGNPRYLPLTIDDIPKIDADKAFLFIKKCLNPADYTFVIIGNIDFEAVSNLVQTYLASIPQGASFNQWEQPDPAVKRPGKTDAVVRKGKEDKGYVYSGRFIAKKFDENTAMVCNVLSEYLDIVLVRSIREKLGGVYSISAGSSLLPIPPDGELRLVVFFACDPKRAVELNAAVEAELAKIASGDIDADTFLKAQKALIKNWEQNMESNRFLSHTFANYDAFFNIPISHLYDRNNTYTALRSNDMQNLMKQILGTDPATVILYPAGE
jgi:zinc protease